MHRHLYVRVPLYHILLFIIHISILFIFFFFFFNDTATTEIYTLSLHDALPISPAPFCLPTPSSMPPSTSATGNGRVRSEEHTSELQSRPHLVCRLLLEKKKKKQQRINLSHTNNDAHPDCRLTTLEDAYAPCLIV